MNVAPAREVSVCWPPARIRLEMFWGSCGDTLLVTGSAYPENVT